MGILTCILFAVIATWITVSIQSKWRPKGLIIFFTIGILSGVLGCASGIFAGWGDVEKFNLFSVFLSIFLVVPVAFIISRISMAYASGTKPAGGN